MKQVPEDKHKLSRKQQLETLRAHLAGNHAFAICRGKLGQDIGSIADNLIDEAFSPTNFLYRWDGFFGQVRVMTNLLAQLRRDGLNIAYRELSGALSDSDYLLPGETLPVEATRPITVLMLEPEKTITFLRWLLEAHPGELRKYLGWKDDQQNWQGDPPSQLTQKLYELFPALDELARKYRDGYPGTELSVAYRRTVAETFSFRPLKKGKVCNLVYTQWNDDIEHVDEIPFIYFFEAEQSKVLRRFSRQDQKRVATWQLQVPKTVERFCIGLHPENLRIARQRLYPMFHSRGASHGFAVTVIDRNPLKGKHPYPVTYNSSGEPGKYGMVFRPDW